MRLDPSAPPFWQKQPPQKQSRPQVILDQGQQILERLPQSICESIRAQYPLIEDQQGHVYDERMHYLQFIEGRFTSDEFEDKRKHRHAVEFGVPEWLTKAFG